MPHRRPPLGMSTWCAGCGACCDRAPCACMPGSVVCLAVCAGIAGCAGMARLRAAHTTGGYGLTIPHALRGLQTDPGQGVTLMTLATQTCVTRPFTTDTAVCVPSPYWLECRPRCRRSPSPLTMLALTPPACAACNVCVCALGLVAPSACHLALMHGLPPSADAWPGTE